MLQKAGGAVGKLCSAIRANDAYAIIERMENENEGDYGMATVGNVAGNWKEKM